jgi:hypothetical protein
MCRREPLDLWTSRWGQVLCVSSASNDTHKDRLKQTEREAVKFAAKNMGSKHHLLSEQELWEQEQKEQKRLQIQERARQRIAEAEAKDPRLKAKNPHLLDE